MDERKPFAAGDEFEEGGIRYRVLNGDRCDGDLVIEFNAPGWHRPKLSHSYILADFKFQVEENNYGRNGKIKKAQGGWKLLNAIKMACKYGWRQQADATQKEVDNKFVKKERDLFGEEVNPFV